MEIFVDDLDIQVDSLDILNLQEEQALAAAGDEAAQEGVRQDFAARREAMNGNRQVFTFTMSSLNFVEQFKAVDLARKMGLWDGDLENLSPFVMNRVFLLMRLKSWTGFETKGQPLACDEANKLRVFGQAPLVIGVLERKLAEQEAAERKNSGTSATG